MNKRILSLFLVLCMILVALPVFAVAAVAEENAETVNIYFKLPDGTEVAKRTIPVGPGVFEEPTEAEINAALEIYNANEKVKGYELTRADILGFYEVKPDGEIIACSAYANSPVLRDKTFCAITTKAVFRDGVNWPLYTSKTSFGGYRGGWTFAAFNGSAFTTMSNYESAYDIINTGSTWGYGGVYLSQTRGITANNASLSLVWKAIAPGTVNVDLLALRFDQTSDGATNSDIAVAIAKNGTIVWPAAAKDKTLAETWSTAGSGESNTWFYTGLGSLATGSVLDKYAAHCKNENDAPYGIEVEAGDRIEIVLKRSGTPHITCFPAITYQEGTVGTVDAAKAGISLAVKEVYDTTYSSSTNYPTYESQQNGAVTFLGNWDMLYYKRNVWSDSTRILMNRVVNVATAGDANDGFFSDGTSLWNGNTVRITNGNVGYWGAAGSFSMQGDGKAIGGYRYTAEYSGLADISFGDYKTVDGNALLAVFLNGQMIWPQVGDYFGDLSKWETMTTTAKTPTNLPTNLLLRKGDMLEFLVAPKDGASARGVTVMPMNVKYTEVYAETPDVQVATDEKDDRCDITLTVNPGNMTGVTVEQMGRDGNYTELTGTDGVYSVSAVRDMDASYDVVFRVTYEKDDLILYPQTLAVTVRSYMLVNYNQVADAAFADQTNGFTVNDGETLPTNLNGWGLVTYKNVSQVTDTKNAATVMYRWYFSAGALSAVNGNPAPTDVSNENAFFVVSGGNNTGLWGKYYAPFAYKNAVAGYRYTVPDSGRLFLSASKVGRLANGFTYTSGSSKLAITLNGRQIWPANGEWYTIEAEGDLTDAVRTSIESTLSNVYVEKGDIIEYLVTGSDTSLYRTGAIHFFGSATVYQSKDTPVAPSSVASYAPRMDGTFGVRLNLAAADASVIGYEATATVGGRALTVTYDEATNSFLLSGIRSTEMMQSLSYTVWAISEHNGAKHYHKTAETETTYAALVAAYLESDDAAVRDMAIAILNYGAAAQTRFLEEPGELPTTLLGDKTLSFETPAAEDKYAQTDREEKAYGFTGATLLLQDRIRLKLWIDLQAGADMLDGDLYLEYGTDAGFAGAEKALLLQRGNEGDDKSNAHLKATLDILPTAFAATMYFRVVTADGTVVSSTLTYSVSSYAARSTEDAALTAAILALGKAAENYGG